MYIYQLGELVTWGTEGVPNVVVLQDPAQGHDRARRHEHRGPDYAKTRLLDGEIVEVVSSRRVGW